MKIQEQAKVKPAKLTEKQIFHIKIKVTLLLLVL